MDEPPSLLMNQGTAGNHWLLVALEGTVNRFGIGARVIVKAGGRAQLREVKAGGSYASSNDARQHFGLGAADRVDELTVQWPSGKKTTLAHVGTNRIVTVREPAAE
jgi:hypothetical protein